jgi:hypothetical protein
VNVNGCLRAALAAILLGLPALAPAEAIPFGEYRLLREGMNEAEILMRVGPPDWVSVSGSPWGVERRTWYYIPDGSYSGDWLTRIIFNHNGVVIRLERTPAWQ